MTSKVLVPTPLRKTDSAISMPSGADDQVDGRGPEAIPDPGAREPGTEKEADRLREYMARYQSGDAEAFRLLFDAISGRLTGYLVRMLRDSTVADEVLQEAFIRIHAARATFRPEAQVLPWIYTIVRNAALDRVRRDTRRARQETPHADLALVESSSRRPGREDAEGPSDPRAAQLEAAVRSLPPLQREAILLLKVSGLSLREAAAATNSTVGSMKLRMHRAYTRLRIVLARNPGGMKEGSEQ